MNKKWKEKLQDENSEDYKTLSKKVVSSIEIQLRKMDSNAIVRFLGFR